MRAPPSRSAPAWRRRCNSPAVQPPGVDAPVVNAAVGTGAGARAGCGGNSPWRAAGALPARPARGEDGAGEPAAAIGPSHAEAQPETTLFAARAANPYVPVAAGRYVVAARDGPVSASLTLDVGDKGPTAANLVLNAGTLLVRAQAQKSGAPLGDAVVAVSDAGQVAEGKKDAAGPPLAMFKGSEGLLVLPDGRYIVRVEQGLVRTERSVVVPAGSQGRLDVPLGAARLLVSVGGQDSGANAEPVVFSVVEDDPDAPKGRREVARSAARQADFVLPPGTYYVVARQGGAEARERLAVGPGDVVRRTLNVAAGRLALATKPVGAAPGPAELVSYRVERLDSSPPEVIATSRAAPVLVLPAGRYRVEGRYGAMNARTVRDVEVKAGPDAAADAGAPGGRPQAAPPRQWRPCTGGRAVGHPRRGRSHRVDHGAIRAIRDAAGGALYGAGGDARQALRPRHRSARGRAAPARAGRRLRHGACCGAFAKDVWAGQGLALILLGLLRSVA